MEFLERVTLAEALIFIGGVLFLLGILKKAWPWLTRAVRTVDALDALPGLVEEMRTSVAAVSTVVAQVDVIHHEVTPNGGGSIKDEIRRQSETLARLERAQLDLEAQGKMRDDEIEGVRAEQRHVAERLALQADALLGALAKPTEPPADEEPT